MPERSDRKNRLMRTIVSHSLSKPSRSTENLRRRGVYPPGVAPTSNRQLEGLALFDAWPGPIRPRVSHGSLVAMVLALSLASLGLPAEVQGRVQVQTKNAALGAGTRPPAMRLEISSLLDAESAVKIAPRVPTDRPLLVNATCQTLRWE